MSFLLLGDLFLALNDYFAFRLFDFIERGRLAQPEIC